MKVQYKHSKTKKQLSIFWRLSDIAESCSNSNQDTKIQQVTITSWIFKI